MILGFCLLVVSGPVFGQTTGTLEGRVADQNGGALPGVTVELSGPRLQGPRTTVTTAAGEYRFLSLIPGDYQVTATLEGFARAQKKATVSLDALTTANLEMKVSASAEVLVTGEAPLIDRSSTTSGSSYAGKVIDKLPLPSRNYADIVFTQPGTQADNGETQGRSLAISIYGSTSAENSFLIDGVNTTNVIKGIQGKDINSEFIQEVEVKTSGYQAEYGRNTGGVINVITKSGGNEFHGGIFGYYNNLSLAADQKNLVTPDFSETGNSLATTLTTKNTRSEGGLDLGGFMVKDRVWFFAAYDRVITGTEIQPTGGVTAGYDFPATYTENKYSLKLTLNLAPSTTLQGVYFSDRQSQVGTVWANPQSFDPFVYDGRIDVGGPDYGARLNQLFGAGGLLTLAYGQHADRYETKPKGPGVAYVDQTTVASSGYANVFGGYGSVFGATQNNHSSRNAYAATYTGYVGGHEFKVGADYERVSTSGSSYYTGGQGVIIRACTQTGTRTCDLSQAPLWTNADGDTLPVFFEHLYYSANADPSTFIPVAPFQTPTKRYSGFAQDQWRIIPALTVNFGVRYDAETLYNSLGGKAFSLTNEWAPRLGVTWDWAGDGTSKLYASAGRFYYAIPTDLNVRVFAPNTSQDTFNYSPTDLARVSSVCQPGAPTPGCVPRHFQVQVGTLSGDPPDPGLKASYQDEFTIGVEKALDPTLSVGLKGTYRSLGRTVEDRCDLNYNTAPNGSSCALMNPGATGIENPGAIGAYGSCDGSGNPITNPTGYACSDPGQGTPIPPAKRIFKGIELVVRKQFTNEIWAQLSYLGSSLRGNYSGAIRESSGQTDPGINADFDYAGLLANAYGILELDRPNQGRLDAVYNAPWGLSAGLQFYIRTGTPTSIGGFYNGGYPQDLYLEQRGYAGRLPTDYEMNLSLAYNFLLGPVTVTPQAYAFQLLNRQTTTAVNIAFNPSGTFVTDPASPFYGQAGVQPGTTGPNGNDCPANAPHPCTDNPNYRKTTAQISPRQLRFALKVTF
ncbi:MAG TPA: TonB-dependent receptor [Thermoanaerobaculia bacterium]|nr:TonB-dependent receptor [Thermoanaerobaculia bacterium]